MNNLLLNELFSSKIKDRLKETKNQQSLVFFSAFIKKRALEWLAEVINPETKVTVVSRWQKADLVSGASDLEIFEFCRNKNWDFKILNDLHSKLYLLNENKIFLGSANLTSKGFNISSQGNIEIGTEIEATPEDLQLIQNLLDDAIFVDQNLYDSICQEVNETDKSMFDQIDTRPLTWSQKTLDTLEKKVEKLWVHDLFVSPALKKLPDISDEDIEHDCNLLNFNKDDLDSNNYEKEELSKKFESSKMFKWFMNIMKENPNSRKSFGFFSKQLHNSLLDEPPPYRSGVKEYLSFFETWLSEYSTSVIVRKSKVSSSFDLVYDSQPSREFAFKTFVATDKPAKASHNIKRHAWIGLGRSYEEILTDNHQDNFYKHQEGSINTHLKYDLEKEFIKIASDSWLGGPNSNPLAKGLDLSCFHSNSSAIPHRVYEFFNLTLGSNLEKRVILKKGSKEFDAVFLSKKDNRYVLQWDNKFTELLKESVPRWEGIEAHDTNYDSFLYFTDSSKNDQGITIYEVDIVATYS